MNDPKTPFPGDPKYPEDFPEGRPYFFCPRCGAFFTPNPIGEYGWSENGVNKTLGVRLVCPAGHYWVVPGQTSMGILFDTSVIEYMRTHPDKKEGP